jgi:predicted transcriptional regulator
MAQFTRVNGDYQPVQNYDSFNYTNNGVNAVTDGATVQPQGPKLDFFTITFTGAVTTTQFNTAIQTIQQLATIYMYEYTDTTNDTLALAVYPVGAWTTTSLDDAITAAVEACTVAASATFTG